MARWYHSLAESVKSDVDRAIDWLMLLYMGYLIGTASTTYGYTHLAQVVIGLIVLPFIVHGITALIARIIVKRHPEPAPALEDARAIDHR